VNNGNRPFSEDGEKGVLCSLLLAPGKVAALCSKQLRPRAFYIPAHQILYNTILESDKPDETVDFVWLLERLKTSRQLEEAGGKEALSAFYSFVPTPANAEFYIKLVREKYVLRRMVQLCDKLSDQCQDQQADVGSILAEAEREVSEIVQSNNGAGDGLPEIKSIAEIVADNPPKPPEIIKGLLHQALKLMVGGPSKARKTWLLMHLALAIATGRMWLGHQCQKGPVLYINFELSEPFFQERAVRILKQMGVEEIPSNFYELNLRGYAGPAEQILPKVARKIRQLPQPLLAIIIDPTYKLMGSTRDENSAVDIASLMNEVDRLAVQTGASVISAAHFAKGDSSKKEAIDKISGSGVFGRDPDSILMMSPLNTEDAFQLHFILRCLPPKKEIAIKWSQWCFEPDSTLDPADLKKTGGRPPKYTAQDLLDILGGESFTDKVWAQNCEEQTGMSKPSFNRLKRELVAAKRVYCSKIDNTWATTPKEASKCQNRL
jgi:hypothetical protein